MYYWKKEGLRTAAKLCLSVQLSFYPTIHLSIHPTIYSSNLPFIQSYINPTIHPSVCLSVFLSIYLSVCLCLYIHPSIHISMKPNYTKPKYTKSNQTTPNQFKSNNQCSIRDWSPGTCLILVKGPAMLLSGTVCNISALKKQTSNLTLETLPLQVTLISCYTHLSECAINFLCGVLRETCADIR